MVLALGVRQDVAECCQSLLLQIRIDLGELRRGIDQRERHAIRQKHTHADTEVMHAGKHRTHTWSMQRDRDVKT